MFYVSLHAGTTYFAFSVLADLCINNQFFFCTPQIIVGILFPQAAFIHIKVTQYENL